MKSSVIMVSVAVVSAIIAVFAYSQIDGYLERREERKEAQDAVYKLVSEQTAAVEALLRLEIEDNSMTFGELFSTADDRIKKITDTLVPVRMSELSQERSEVFRHYLESLQELLRNQAGFYRKSLALSGAYDSIKDAMTDLAESSDNVYSYKYARQRLQRAKVELQKAEDEYEESKTKFKQSLAELDKQVKAGGTILQPALIVNSELLQKVLHKYNPSVPGDEKEEPSAATQSPRRK